MGLAYLEWRRRAAAKAGEGYSGFGADTQPQEIEADMNLQKNGSTARQFLAFVPYSCCSNEQIFV